MLSGESGKTIFKCLQFSYFLAAVGYVHHFCLKSFSLFFYGRSEGPRAVACTRAALPC